MATLGVSGTPVTINVLRGTYRPPSARGTVIETQLLAGATLGDVASVLQQGGRLRKRTSFETASTPADHETFAGFHLAGTLLEFTGPDGAPTAFGCHIETLSEPTLLKTGLVTYGITLVEA